ncbi:hypothetical protein os1_01040 [Comamonadaceae bacterium OS-1]|nr:hypothetical protein os1_01040 [Comamonadaceae bacterium OS-1]
MNPKAALLELTLMNAEVDEESFENFFIKGTKMGIPAEVLTRLNQLWEQVQVIGGHVIAVGKIIVERMFAFLSANPRIAVGAAIGLAVGYLLTGIPFIGALLAPLVTVLGIAGSSYGAATQNDASPSALAVLTALVEKFFELLRSVFEGVAQYVEAVQ